eukprot:COSAG03_NODE_4804_length_1427_cov_1.340361_1_plen_146_part_00
MYFPVVDCISYVFSPARVHDVNRLLRVIKRLRTDMSRTAVLLSVPPMRCCPGIVLSSMLNALPAASTAHANDSPPTAYGCAPASRFKIEIPRSRPIDHCTVSEHITLGNGARAAVHIIPAASASDWPKRIREPQYTDHEDYTRGS